VSNKVPSADIITEYSAAFEAANGTPAPKINYVQGWFLFLCDHGFGERVDARKRASEMLEMRERLLRRAAQKAQERHETAANVHDILEDQPGV
jgi:hypothetical protein